MFKVGDKVKHIKSNKVGQLASLSNSSKHVYVQWNNEEYRSFVNVDSITHLPKLTVGDEVRINGPTVHDDNNHLGRVGTVSRINRANSEIIYVKFDDYDGDLSNPYGIEDLELYRPSITYKKITPTFTIKSNYQKYFEQYGKNLMNHITNSFYIPSKIPSGTDKSPEPKKDETGNKVKLVEYRKQVTTKDKYPVLMTSKLGECKGGVVMMFIAPNKAFVVKSNNKYIPVGEYNEDYTESNFVPYNQEITISNE